MHCSTTGSYTVGQGACSDGTYVYFLLRTPENGNTIIKKYNLATGEYIKRSEPIYVFHGNDMTLDTKRNIIYISHGSSEGKILTSVNPDTLEVIEQTINIEKGSGAITYSPTRDSFAISQGGKNVIFLNNDLSYVKTVKRTRNDAYTAQGMGSDDDFIYFPMSGSSDNILMVYDWAGKYITTVTIPSTLESESMFFVNGSYYVNFYSGDGARLFKLSFVLD